MPGAVVIQLSRLGDLHQTLPVLRALELRFDCNELFLICCDDFSNALPESAFSGNKIALPRATLARWANRLRESESGKCSRDSVYNQLPEKLRRPFALAINLTHDEPSSALMELLQAEKSVGRVWSEAGEIRLAGDWSKYLFALVNNRLDNLFNLVDIQLGIAGLSHGARPPAMTIQSEESQKAFDLLYESGWDGNSECIAIQMGASDSFRALGPNRFAAALTRLAEKRNICVVMVGTTSELPLASIFCKAFSGKCVNLVGKTSMEQLPILLATCRLLISNDTGTLHVAASIGTPTLGLFFATAYFSETAPYGSGHVVLQSALPCSPCNSSQRCQVQHCRLAFTAEPIASVAEWILSGMTTLAPGPFPSLELYASEFLQDGTLLYQPVPGWPVSVRYLKALAWRKAFARRLGLTPELRLPSTWALPQLPHESLKELALCLEDVSNRLGGMHPFQKGRQASGEPLIWARETMRLAFERLIESQQNSGFWGDFVRFDLLGPESGSDSTLDKLQIRHHHLATMTRDFLTR